MKNQLKYDTDVRGLASIGPVKDVNGVRTLFRAADSYANVCAALRELEEADPTQFNEGEHQMLIEFVRKEKSDLAARIVATFEPALGKEIDQGLKSKFEKAMAAAEKALPPGNPQSYWAIRKSRTYQAILRALKGGSHADLKSQGFNDHQASDAKAWLDDQKGAFGRVEDAQRGPKRKDSNEK